VVADEEAAVSLRVFVDADGQYSQVGLRVVEFEQ
jgi:hypothetical protein